MTEEERAACVARLNDACESIRDLNWCSLIWIERRMYELAQKRGISINLSEPGVQRDSLGVCCGLEIRLQPGLPTVLRLYVLGHEIGHSAQFIAEMRTRGIEPAQEMARLTEGITPGKFAGIICTAETVPDNLKELRADMV